MSNDDKKQQRPEIPVRRMRFRYPMDIPGKSVTESCDGEKDPRRPEANHHTIVYLPHMRHHLITWNAGKDTRSAYVHETHVASWEPLV